MAQTVKHEVEVSRGDIAVQVEALQANFEQEFLTYTTAPADAMTIATVFRILSTHADNEQYLDDDKSEWIQVSSLHHLVSANLVHCDSAWGHLILDPWVTLCTTWRISLIGMSSMKID